MHKPATPSRNCDLFRKMSFVEGYIQWTLFLQKLSKTVKFLYSYVK